MEIIENVWVTSIVAILSIAVWAVNDHRRYEKKNADFWREEYIKEHHKYNRLLNVRKHEG